MLSIVTQGYKTATVLYLILIFYGKVMLNLKLREMIGLIMHKFFNKSSLPLWLAFLLPIIIMGTYFAIRGMMPFGNSSILTVDLGQQYVDMFALYRNTILQHPSTFLYSFSNALGSDMFGLWTYYLMSPLNLILIFFKPTNLPTGILILTLLKYGLTGFTMAYSLKRLKWQQGWLLSCFGVMYALMGWMVSYELNLLWLDAAILLPLIILGLEQLFITKRIRNYIIPLTALFIINYYMAYMVAIFLVIYTIWRLSWEPKVWQQLIKKTSLFIGSSIASALLATCTLLPTAYSLTQGKGQYMTEKIGNWLEYNPLLFFSKFFIGSFNFEQMPSGQPNIFIGSLGIVAALLFFTNSRPKLVTKIITLLITIFLFISMFLAPLDLFWHGFQFPVWYPYRFSFIWSFWLLWLGAYTFQEKEIQQKKQITIILLSFVIVFLIVAFTMAKTNFMTWPQVLVGSAFYLITFCLIIAPRFRYWSWLLLLLVICECATNVAWTLNNFSYLTKSEYQTNVAATSFAVNSLPKSKSKFYRIGQTYERTKGDAFMQDYFGGSAFSSSFSKKTSDFMGYIGNPDGDNYAVYANGTMLTDNLLSFKYYLDAKNHFSTVAGAPANMLISQRPDLTKMHALKQTLDVSTYQNNNTLLGLGFAANSGATNVKFELNNPLSNQQLFWNKLTGSKTKLFSIQNFDRVTATNTSVPSTITGAYITRKKVLGTTSLTLYFTPKTNDSYYLTLGSSMVPDNATITLNGQTIHTNDSFRHTIVVNVAASAKNQQQQLKITLKKSTLWLQNVSLYKLNNAKLNQETNALSNNTLHISKFSQRSISGNITTTANKSLIMTSIPQNKGWQAYLDNKKVKTVTIANMFLGIKTTPGKHTIKLVYTPPYLIVGCLISLLTLIVLITYYLVNRKTRLKKS